jgi:hypothetical protein
VPAWALIPRFASVVRFTDQQLNTTLCPFFAQTFADYSAANLATGIYHPVGTTAQDRVSNAGSIVPAPNGLGDLSADAVRAVGNGIIAQTLAAVGGNRGAPAPPARTPSAVGDALRDPKSVEWVSMKRRERR